MKRIPLIIFLLLGVNLASRFGEFRLEGDKAAEFVEKPAFRDTWINGGYFVLRNEIFDYLHDGEELVEEPFQRLLAAERLAGMRHDGFWSCMDTYKDKQALDELCSRGDAPWEVWKHSAQLDGNTGAARISASKPIKGGRRHA